MLGKRADTRVEWSPNDSYRAYCDKLGRGRCGYFDLVDFPGYAAPLLL